MAVIGVEVADNAIRNRIVNAIAGNYGYKTTVPAPVPTDPPVPNPQSKADFATGILKQYFKEQVRAFEANKAADDARKIADDKVTAEVVIP